MKQTKEVLLLFVLPLINGMIGAKIMSTVSILLGLVYMIIWMAITVFLYTKLKGK